MLSGSGQPSRRRRKESRVAGIKERIEALPEPESVKIRLDDVVKEVV